MSAAVPAEVQQGASGGGDALSRPAEEVELGERAGLLRLHVLQVEAAHQEIIAPDVLRHQVHLHGKIEYKKQFAAGSNRNNVAQRRPRLVWSFTS